MTGSAHLPHARSCHQVPTLPLPVSAAPLWMRAVVTPASALLFAAPPSPQARVCSPTARATRTSAASTTGGRGPSLASVLERLGERTDERAGPVLRAGAAGLVLLAEGPWLSWVRFAFLARLPALGLKPLPLVFERRRCRTGLVARRAAEDLAPVPRFQDITRDIALERAG